MMQRIRRLDIAQMAKTLGATYFLLGIIFAVCFWLISSMFGKMGSGMSSFGGGFGLGMVIFAPVLYGVFGVIFGALMAAIYNLVAGWTGGIGIELEQG